MGVELFFKEIHGKGARYGPYDMIHMIWAISNGPFQIIYVVNFNGAPTRLNGTEL